MNREQYLFVVMKNWFISLALLALFVTSGKAACNIQGGTETYQAGEIGEHTICVSLESSCQHPDPQYYLDNPTTFPNPRETYCGGGGENPQRANNNILTCTAALKNTAYTGSCPSNGTMSTSTEQNVVMYYTPCPKYTGKVDITCKAVRASDDYSSTPGSTVSTGTFSYQYNAIPCVSCLNGHCDDVMGCICPEGFGGENCLIPNSSSLLAPSLVLLSVLVMFVALF